MQTIINFLEQTPSFSAQEVTQGHALLNAIIQKKQTCLKEDDIHTLFKRASGKTFMASKDSFVSSSASRSDVAHLPEEEADDVSASRIPDLQ
jgi:hypothetical protein